jgi:NAD+ synthase (glutamine-hydrolysing)
MKVIGLGAAVLNQTPLDWRGNTRRIRESIRAARDEGASILCLPELCITGYGCEDVFASADLLERSEAALLDLAADSKGMIVAASLPFRCQKSVFIGAALLVDGRLAGISAKQHLAGDGIHYEPRWFRAWEPGRTVLLDLRGEAVVAGDLLFDCGGVRVGFEICEDAWVADRPGAALARRGVDVLLNPSASHFAFGKLDIRRRFVIEGSRALCCAYVYTNLLGNESGRAIFDGGALIASNGRLLAEGTRFSFREWGLCTSFFDVDETRTAAARSATFQPLLLAESAERDVIRRPFDWPSREPERTEPEIDAWETGAHVREEEFVRGVSLGLFDYLRKSRSQGFVLSLSGGADSTTVACLVRALAELALAEIGTGGLRSRLSHISDLPASDAPEAWTARLLTCVYQATAQSGTTTREAARTLAEAIGARFLDVDVDPLVRAYVALAADAVGRPLDWKHDDIALQNIQARVRGPSVWLLANLGDALLLATSNRSEAAVGYATMDGDTCGGLAPLAGINKAFLQACLRWWETVGPEGLGPIPALHAVTSLRPTAELRPKGAGQNDEDDLMPYPILDAIERMLVHDKLAPVEVLRSLPPLFPDRSVPELAGFVSRFYRLWCRNQWKRERLAPSFHIDDESLDPKTWCRFPILSSGFEEEIEELNRLVARLEGSTSKS